MCCCITSYYDHRRSWYEITPPFFTFLFTYLFSIKTNYFVIILSLFPYFNLFVSIFISSYVNSNLHVSVRISIRRCKTLCDKVCQWLARGRWVSPGTPVSSNNKTDRHDITEILLKVVLITIKQTNNGWVDPIYTNYPYKVTHISCC
jgi:hypothetical protein